MDKRHILDNINSEEFSQMVPCFKPVTKYFEPGEEIIYYSRLHPFGNVEEVAVLARGDARLEIINQAGENLILETYHEGDVFGELFSLPLESYSYVVIAEKKCKVVFLNYEHIIKPCDKVCNHHSQLISNLFIMTAQKTQELSLHLSIIGQSTTRKKLMAYLLYCCGGKKGHCFEIPMSLTHLSDYLQVERSAMMRELKVMRDEGIIHNHRREFQILK